MHVAMSQAVAVLQPRRCASVRNVHSLLRTPQGQAAGQAMLLALWPAALQLLQDNQVEMRQTVAPVVGFLGALAARPGRPAGETLLFSKQNGRAFLRLASDNFIAYLD